MVLRGCGDMLWGNLYILFLFPLLKYSDKFCHHVDMEQNTESFTVWVKIDWWQPWSLVN